MAVRGFSSSISRSMSRFALMATVRAATIATVIQMNCESVGHPPAARIMPR